MEEYTRKKLELQQTPISRVHHSNENIQLSHVQYVYNTI